MPNKSKPPKIVKWLLNLFFHDGKNQTANGDFEEIYNEIRKEKGLLYAKLWCWLQVFISIFPFIKGKIYWSLVMFKSYLKISFRNLVRQKGYSFINISGLAIGMACCLLLLAYIFSELSYDKYHEKSDRVYRLCSDFKIAGNNLNIPKSSAKIVDVLKQNYPEIEDVVLLNKMDQTSVKFEDKQFFENKIFFASNSIFNVFSYPMINGDPSTALETAYSVVITEDMVQKYFGTKDPIGQILKIQDEGDFKIKGVIKNVPKNSHFIFDMLCSFQTHYSHKQASLQNWFHVNYYAYLLLQEKTNFKSFESKFPEFITTNMGQLLKAYVAEFNMYLQPLTSIHLHSQLQQEISGNSNIINIYIFSAIALFILLIACINFMNLSTARSANKAKEVGMRKVLGAHRSRLIKQFLGESLIYSFIALLIAFILVGLIIPYFNSLAGIELNLEFTNLKILILGFLGLTLIVGFVAGSYPALFLSKFKPVKVLQCSSKSGAANHRFRNILVLGQFTISILLIIATGITLRQLNFMKHEKLGFNKEQLIVLSIRNDNLNPPINTIKEELKNHVGIINVATASHVPGETTYKNPYIPEGFPDDQSQWMGQYNIDHDFIPTMGIKIVAGRNFSIDFTSDSDQAVLINETAAKQFNWENPIGKKIGVITGPGAKDRIFAEVIGVVQDFHTESLHKKIDPIIISNTSNQDYNALCIRLSPTNMRETIHFIEQMWNEIAPNYPFEYFFLDDSFDYQYREDERLSKIFSYFTFLAIFIACLGLLGLTSFTTEQKTKEIGIRKVLGASVVKVVLLLSKEFIKWIILANIIAWPIAYFFMKEWLQNFAYQTKLGLDIFILSGIAALLITLITVGYQSIKSALANPVESLKYE
jgi:putative ABC transport system permease protein